MDVEILLKLLIAVDTLVSTYHTDFGHKKTQDYGLQITYC